MLGFEEWLGSVPHQWLYVVVSGIVLLESMGIPLPGEIALISASLLAAAGVSDIRGVAIAAAVGAIVGDSIGYAIGRRGGRVLLAWLGTRFPKHFGLRQLERAERIFDRWGVWAIFFGRFVALLRIMAGPLAGALRVPYRTFLIANATGGAVWAFGTSFVIYYVGVAAERYLRDFSWIALVLAAAVGIATTLHLKRSAARPRAAPDDGSPATELVPVPSAVAVDAVAVDAVAVDAVAVDAVEDATVFPVRASVPPASGGRSRSAAGMPVTRTPRRYKPSKPRPGRT